MSSPLQQGRPSDALIEGLARTVTIEWRPMPVAARLKLPTLGTPVLYLDPAASDVDRQCALVETLAVLVAGPDAAVSARRARHLHAIP
jgi:hypothetical protein